MRHTAPDSDRSTCEHGGDGEGLPAGEGRGGEGDPQVRGGPGRLVQLRVPERENCGSVRKPEQLQLVLPR